jgi:GDPmannose 4,6-dehydratase
VEGAFAVVGRKIAWRGSGRDEIGIDEKTGETLIEIDPNYFRPTEVDFLLGDPSKARRELGWKHRVSFEELITEMVKSDLKQLQGA